MVMDTAGDRCNKNIKWEADCTSSLFHRCFQDINNPDEDSAAWAPSSPQRSALFSLAQPASFFCLNLIILSLIIRYRVFISLLRWL